MKKLFTLMAALALTFAFGTAFADQMPGAKKIDAGAYYGTVASKTGIDMRVTGEKGAAPGGIREDKALDKSGRSFEALFGHPKAPDRSDVL